jgi:hypothetical protein
MPKVPKGGSMGPIYKRIRKYISEGPPENIAPWKKPNSKMNKIINMQYKGRLANAIDDILQKMRDQHLEKLFRDSTRR